ncbi:MAG: DUF502 domain-containing protein [Meiothermus sp.]|uniref:DUF502 domain-containing protein n=1 Tax=Meiothermus sp. TaxID=1955249 RepID=UPI0025CD1E53|nr:DUF502 domain-containing protein [Meiothermus sp.]MCS7057660.1 DUF502 domain-containing protein [Meiothermus sp.]MCS7193475.1 DUF502 domain-containing protein [Meiothermus sp.]MCX7741052.1 DUF502 domain-containing protein [Meiothermus sp.]MDW8090871.1 DUF502 domain-containing protein [Meiothermus sp.]MDW8482434.1 DUF502 domain-containing protein [Meiothermus sp.]
MGNRLRRYFIAGLLSTLPIAVTLYVLVWVYNWANGIIEGILRAIDAEPARWMMPFLPILAIVATLGLVTLVGMLTNNYVGRVLFAALDRSIKTIPLVREVYNAVQQIAQTLLGQPEMQFQRAALIEYPRKGLYTLCFIASPQVGRRLSPLPEGYTVVLVPTSPVPASGMAIIVPTADVIPLDISIEDALKYVVSAGFILPESRARQLWAHPEQTQS